MKSRMLVCAVAVGASLLASSDALAKGRKGGKNKGDRIELTRPSDSPDPNAQGTVRVEHRRRGDQTVIDLSRLDARSTFEVRDSGTGELLGTVKTNRKGRATFNLTKTMAKAASLGGSEAEDIQNVDVVDPDTGDTVLTGDVQADPAGPQFGYGDYTGEAGDSASIYMDSIPEADYESFSLTFWSSRESFAAVYYDLYRDTSAGDKLPLDASSVSELAGRAFQIVDPDGTVVIEDKLPILEESEDCYGFDDIWEGDPGDFDDEGDWGNWYGDDGIDWSWTEEDPATGDDANSAGTVRHGNSKRARRGGVKEEPVVQGFTLRIADENGDLQLAGELTEHNYDYGDCPVYDGGDDWSGDWGDGSDNGFFIIGFIIIPFDGDFDWSILGDLFGGHDGSDDPSNSGESGARHGHR